MTSSFNQLCGVVEEVQCGVRSAGQIAGCCGGHDGVRPTIEADSIVRRYTEKVRHYEAGKGLEEGLHDVSAPIVLEYVETLIDK